MSVSVELFVFTDGSKAQVVRSMDGRVFSFSRKPIKGLDYEIPSSISNVLRSYDQEFKIIDVAKHIEALKEHPENTYRIKTWKEVLDGKQDLFLSSFTFSNGKMIPVIRGNHRIAFVKLASLKQEGLISDYRLDGIQLADKSKIDFVTLFGKNRGQLGAILHIDDLIEHFGKRFPILNELLEQHEEEIIPMPRKRSHESHSEEVLKKTKNKTSSFGNTDIDALIETTVQEQVKAVFQTREIQDAIKERILKALK